MIFGALLAGGVGSRMNIESMPKQFLPLGSKPVFVHTLQKFQMVSRFDAIYVGVHKDWLDFARESAAEASLGSVPVHIVAGGEDRNGTIMSIIAGIEERYGAVDDAVIVTHDSVRPFVKVSTIEANISALADCDACDTGLFIDSIPERRRMFQGQTPQSFRIGALKEVYGRLSEDDRRILTDACKMFVMANRPVKLVEGDVTNIKLTTVMDYKVAQAMLESGAE